MKKNFYSESQKQLQKKFKTIDLAARLEDLSVREALNDFSIAFIETIDMVFISSVNENGFPTVSYKGGMKGFIKVRSRKKILIPNYDGNGMFLTMGNILKNEKVGLLLISFEKPYRIRVEGLARVSYSKKLLSFYPGANAIILVSITRVWENCPRYIHRATSFEVSKSIPTSDIPIVDAKWKKIDLLQDVLPKEISMQNSSSDLITADQWKQSVLNGDPDAV